MILLITIIMIDDKEINKSIVNNAVTYDMAVRNNTVNNTLQ